MIVAAIAVVCAVGGSPCKDILVSSSELGPLSMQECLMGAPALAEWMKREHPAEILAGWKCILGERKNEL